MLCMPSYKTTLVDQNLHRSDQRRTPLRDGARSERLLDR